MKRILMGICLLTVTAFILTGCGSKDKVVVGSKDFTENIILAELLAQMIEGNTDIKVDRKLNMGGTFVNFEALKKGEIDLYPEYTGTGLTAQLKMDVLNDADEVYNIVQKEFNEQFNIKWLQELGINNTYAIAVKEELANELGLEKVSDLIPHAPNLIFGGEHEFFNRQDGYDGLIEVYGLNFKEEAKMNVSLKYQAIGQGTMDVTDAFVTDGQLIAFNLVLLEDDLGFFPPYYAAPIVRNETLEKYPELEGILNQLGGAISDREMSELNYRADNEKEDIKDIVKSYLAEKGLVK